MRLTRHAWVLEPEAPRRADAQRRVALGARCSLLLGFDLGAPRAPPPEPARFMGSDAAVAPLRRALRERAAAWDPARWGFVI